MAPSPGNLHLIPAIDQAMVYHKLGNRQLNGED